MTRQAFGAMVLALVAANTSNAQRTLPVGERVRVAIPERPAQAESRMMHAQFVRGVLESVSGDTLFIRPSPYVGVLAIPLRSVESLQCSRGVPGRLQSAIVSGIGGAAFFALDALIYSSIQSPPNGRTHRDMAISAAKFGGVFFLALGFVWPVERWRRVPLD